MAHHFQMNRRTLLTACIAAGAVSSRELYAQDMLKILVGFPAGGAIDLAARVYAEAVAGLGTTIVDNRPGAAGNIAAAALAQARPDGRTMMFAPVNVYCTSQALYSKPGFDVARDFTPVGIVARFPWAIAVHPSVPAQDLTQFIDWLKINRETVSCGMAAVGSEGHLMAYAFSRAIGVNLQFAPYKGGAPMSQDLIAGHIPFAFDPFVNFFEPHKASKVRILAITSTERSPLVPNIPTFGELGFRGATGDTWIGAAVRTGTPTAQIQSIVAALASAEAKPEVQSRLAARGLSTVSPTPAVMAKMIEADTERYTGLIKAMGLKIA